LKSSNSRTGLEATARRKSPIVGYQDQIVSLLWTKPVQLSLHFAKVSL
jgi:hypothetical protein